MPTQIQFKRGTTTPTGLTVGEPAFDTATNRLFIGNTAAVRWIGGEITGGVDMGAGSAASQNRVPTQNAVYEYARRNFVASFNGATGAVTGASLGANTFSGLQTSSTGFSGPLTGNATSATNATQLGGVAAASYALLASPTFTGTPAAPTANVGTNTTQIATTAFVQSEIVADTVTSFNGRTGAAQGVSAAVAGDGISVSGATGAVTITNTGVTRAAAGNGISVSANTGTVTISNTGVLSFNGNAGAVQGVSAAVAGTGILVSGATGAVTITNIGVQSFNGLTGAVTGVTVGGANTFTALQSFNSGISANGGTFSVQLNAQNFRALTVGGDEGGQIDFGLPVTNTTLNSGVAIDVWQNRLRIFETGGTNRGVFVDLSGVSASVGTNLIGGGGSPVSSVSGSGNGISVSPTTGSVVVQNTGVHSFNGATGAVTGASLGANTFSGLQTSSTGFSGPLTGNATTATTATNSTQLGGVAAASYALLSSPTFTGTPAAPTATVGTNSTQIATTAFVQNEIVADTVTSFNGLTGAVGGVTTSAANTFTAVQTFNSGVTFASTTDHTGNARFAGGINVTSSIGITSSGPLTVTHNITQTGPTRGISAEGFLSVSGGATFNTSVATNLLVNRTAGATFTFTTVSSGTNANLNIFPYGNLSLSPQSVAFSGGSRPSIYIQNSDQGIGQIQFAGGNLYLGTREDAFETFYPVDIVFTNPNTAFSTTLTAPNTTTSNKTITLPDATGTVALTNSVVTSFNGLTGAVTGVTLGGVNTFTRFNTFNAGICAAGGLTLSSGRINFTSASVTISPFTINAASLNDGVGAIRINSSEPDINLNDTDGGFSTFTFENNSVARVALGRNSNDAFYLAVRDPSVSGGAWKDNVIVANSSTGNVDMGYNLGVTGSVTAQSLTGTSVARAWFM